MNITKTFLAGSLLLGIVACTADQSPQEIALEKDLCDDCKMNITEKGYATELVTAKGKVYKFDDIQCLEAFKTANPDKAEGAKTYAVDFPSKEFVDTEKATFITGGDISSPMGGNTQAF
ncbi:MAG: nitrous oxide reductase accessory protein NosL, partial [Bergeyella zoohelcum]|nr:nitrous oxide reductase accessory protein NosL [Bergeyella zoohelcum]